MFYIENAITITLSQIASCQKIAGLPGIDAVELGSCGVYNNQQPAYKLSEEQHFKLYSKYYSIAN